MNNIRKNPGQLINLLLGTLKRKPITNTIARENFVNAIFGYYEFITKVSHLDIKNPKFDKQLKYISQLDILVGRYMSIGDETISDDKLDDFLDKLKLMIIDYTNNLTELEELLFEIEKEHYTNLAYKQEYSNNTKMDRRIEELKSDAVDMMKYGKNKYVTFENE